MSRLVICVEGKGTQATADQVLAALNEWGYPTEGYVMARATDDGQFAVGTYRFFDTEADAEAEAELFAPEGERLAHIDSTVGHKEYYLLGVLFPGTPEEDERMEARLPATVPETREEFADWASEAVDAMFREAGLG
jgi:hypothetical protein